MLVLIVRAIGANPLYFIINDLTIYSRGIMKNATTTHGGARPGAGRKHKADDEVLKFQVRVSEKEKLFLKFARENKLNLDELMR